MKKISFLLILFIITVSFVSCNAAVSPHNSEPSSTESVPTAAPSSEATTNPVTPPESTATEKEPIPPKPFTLIGRFYCVSYYCQTQLTSRDDIPYIEFFEEGKCEMFVNYLGGVVTFPGVYSENDFKVYVDLDLAAGGESWVKIDESLGKPYMDDKYEFVIYDDGSLKIGPVEGSYYKGDCYVVKSGDRFEKVVK